MARTAPRPLIGRFFILTFLSPLFVAGLVAPHHKQVHKHAERNYAEYSNGRHSSRGADSAEYENRDKTAYG